MAMSLQGRLDQIEERIGYKFKNKLFLFEATIHKSYASHYQLGFDYERLEYLGDALLQAYTSEILYMSNQGDQGSLTQARAGLVSRDMLSRLTRELGIEPYVLAHKNLRNSDGKILGSFLGDYFESILAAIYLDGGHEHAKRFVRRIYGRFGYLEAQIDYKSKLQEMSLKATKELPAYVTILTDDGYLAEVSLRDGLLASGIGRSKKKAEQMAARNAVDAFHVVQGIKEA